MLIAFTDGAVRVSNPGVASSAWVLYKDGNLVHKQGRVLEGLQTNNVAEYSALLDFLKWAEANAVRNVVIHCDSMLVVEQTNQRWKCDKPELKSMMGLAYGLLVRGSHVLKHCKGHAGVVGNEAADALCNAVLDIHKEEYNGNKVKSV
jgi:ribonuclease HI